MVNVRDIALEKHKDHIGSDRIINVEGILLYKEHPQTVLIGSHCSPLPLVKTNPKSLKSTESQ